MTGCALIPAGTCQKRARAPSAAADSVHLTYPTGVLPRFKPGIHWEPPPHRDVRQILIKSPYPTARRPVDPRRPSGRRRAVCTDTGVFDRRHSVVGRLSYRRPGCVRRRQASGRHHRSVSARQWCSGAVVPGRAVVYTPLSEVI